MGLFNRGSKSDVPLNGDESVGQRRLPQARGDARAEPRPSARLYRPRSPRRPSRRFQSVTRRPPSVPRTLGAIPSPSRIRSPSRIPSPSPSRRRTPAPVEAKPMPPVNRSEPEDGDDQRMSAEQALAPRAQARHEPPARRPHRRRVGAPREDHLVREPEGRRREDDHDPEPGGRVHGVRPRRAGRRPGPAGQPDDEPGHRPRQGRALDVRRARRPHPDPGRDPPARDRHRRRLDRPRRRRDRDEHADRPRALAREGAVGGRSTTTTSSASTPRRASGC